MESQGRKQLEYVELELCTNNLYEMVDLIDELPDSRQVPPEYRDLFLEQRESLQLIFITWCFHFYKVDSEL